MKLITSVVMAGALSLIAGPASAEKYDCDKGFKDHMMKMSIYIDKTSGYELADAVRRSYEAYNSCKAGDGFSPHGVWDEIDRQMAEKARGK